MNATLVLIALLMVLLVCAGVAIHLHPELLDAVKNWFSNLVQIPHM